MTEAYSDDAAHIRSLLSDIATAHGGRLANELPPLNIGQPDTNLFTTSTIDVSELVHLRFLHQTKQAETGVRKVGSCESTANPGRQAKKPLSERQQIIRKFAEIIKQQDDRGIGTGLERSARWISKGSRSEKGTRKSEAIEKTSGNSANAAAVADATASSVRQHNLIN